MEFNRISSHKIEITHSANGGCFVKVGCGKFAFTKPEEMLEALAEYYKDPRKMEKEYNSENGPELEAEMTEDAQNTEEAPQVRPQQELRRNDRPRRTIGHPNSERDR